MGFDTAELLGVQFPGQPKLDQSFEFLFGCTNVFLVLFDQIGVNGRLFVPIALKCLQKPLAEFRVDQDALQLSGDCGVDVWAGDADLFAVTLAVGAVVVLIGRGSGGRFVVFDLAFGGHQATAAPATDEAGEREFTLLGLDAVVFVQDPLGPIKFLWADHQPVPALVGLAAKGEGATIEAVVKDSVEVGFGEQGFSRCAGLPIGVAPGS
ncbi:MAG: hypothetical protein AAB669_01740 [Patescibacteria group bacterium]